MYFFSIGQKESLLDSLKKNIGQMPTETRNNTDIKQQHDVMVSSITRVGKLKVIQWFQVNSIRHTDIICLVLI